MAEKNTEKQRAAEQQLAEIAKITDEELFKRLDTDEEGLNQVEASDRLEEYGANIIDTGNENSLAKRVREAIINPFNIVLLIVAAVTLVTDVIIAEKPSWATFLMLIFVVAVSGIISFVQAEKSNSAAEKLQNKISNKIDVIRNGSAKAVILTTGNRTYLGSMAKSLNTYQDKSSFERNINSISSLLIKFMVVMVPVIFIAIFLTQGSWLDSLMFGITIAVGLMPEMLPVIMTSSLAKGAVNMSKKQTIVKRLGSIQTFGEMDILCTDKKSGLYTLSSFTVCIAFNAVLKLTACVYRPWIRDSRVLPAGDAITTATGYSFPSGHTSTAVPIYGSLAVSVRKAQKWISVLCIVCLVLTAFSRNYLGVHTPQDVLTATALGISAIFGMSKLFRYLSAHPEKENYFLLAGVILGICGILFISLKTYPMDYVDGKLLVDPDRMMKDDYGDVGALIAFCIARFIEKTWIQFKPVLSKKALVCGLAGAVIMFFMRESLGTPLKSLLGLHWGCFAENLIIISFIVAVWPLVMKHATKTEEPAVPVPAEAS